MIFPTPRNLNYLWTFGGILTFCLVAQLVTGIVLAMHYQPSAAEAFNSVDRIRRDVNFGWLIQPMHAVGASMFFIAVYIHIFRGLYYGSYKAPREVLWILGVFILLAMMATAFMGYALPWGQMSFWGVTVITNLFSALDSIWSGSGHGDRGVAVGRLCGVGRHAQPLLLAALPPAVRDRGSRGLAHLGAARGGSEQPDRPRHQVEVRLGADVSRIAIAKDAVGLFAFLIVFAWFVFFMPDYLGHADNYIAANALVTPPHIVPEWYFLPFYAILRAVPSKLGGVIAMFAAVLILVFVPWLDTSRVRSAKYRPLLQVRVLVLRLHLRCAGIARLEAG